MATAPEHLPYRDATIATDVRLDDLLARMTLDEKLAQIGCVWSSKLLTTDVFNPAAARELLAHGIGHVTRIGGATVLGPRESAAFTNAVQRFLVEETRLGIPAIVHEESCAGYTAKGATCFPQAIGLAATFAPELIERMTRVIREQMLAVGARHTLPSYVSMQTVPDTTASAGHFLSGLASCAQAVPASRMSAAAPGVKVLAPARHMASLLKVPQFGQSVCTGTQSATHSSRFPTMSKAPSVDTQLLRDPVATVVNTLCVLQSVVPLSGPGSGVPTTAACHSAFDGSRLRAFLHATCAWNQVMFADGFTPGRLTA